MVMKNHQRLNKKELISMMAKNINEDESKKMEINESEETQTTNEESASSSSATIPKPTTNADQQDPRKLLAAEMNEKDIKTAAASALAAASVKAKVCFLYKIFSFCNVSVQVTKKSNSILSTSESYRMYRRPRNKLPLVNYGRF